MDDAVLTERLRLLAQYLDELRGFRKAARSFQVYVDNVMLRRAVERGLQVAVEICLDIGRRLIALEGFRYAKDNQDVFRVLADEGVVSGDLLETLLEMARFRNLIVHDYAEIDNARVYGILKKHLDDFDAYAQAIADYLSRA
ncbi:MAG: DUF86 domain-containing protein [Chloroflexaceae bacterium]|nr:DUF86 domain-containing protein [Chloroflexaceae bacterium]